MTLSIDNLSQKSTKWWLIVAGIVITILFLARKSLAALFGFGTALTSGIFEQYKINAARALVIMGVASDISTEKSAFNSDEDKIVSLVNALKSTMEVRALKDYYLQRYSSDLSTDLESFLNIMDWNAMNKNYREILEP